MVSPTQKPEAVLLRPDDNVAVATRSLPRGHHLDLGELSLETTELIRPGHKVATRSVKKGGRNPSTPTLRRPPDGTVPSATAQLPHAWHADVGPSRQAGLQR